MLPSRTECCAISMIDFLSKYESYLDEVEYISFFYDRNVVKIIHTIHTHIYIYIYIYLHLTLDQFLYLETIFNTRPLKGESVRHQWLPLTHRQICEVLVCWMPEQTAGQTVDLSKIWNVMLHSNILDEEDLHKTYKDNSWRKLYSTPHRKIYPDGANMGLI